MYYFNWDVNQLSPQAADEDFIHMTKNGKWNSEKDTTNNWVNKKQFGVICQDIDSGE